MKKWKLTILGTGMMGNSPKHINETFEIEENTFLNLQNSKTKSSVLESLLTVRIPGIIIDTNKLQINSEEISKPLIDKKLGTAIVGGIVGAKLARKGKDKKQNKQEKNEFSESIPFDDSLKEILLFQWNGNLLDTINKLKNITLLTTGYNWEFNADEIGKENNRLLSQCLKQYNNGYKYYKKQIEFKEIKSGKNKLTRRKIKDLYKIYIIVGMALSLLGIMALLE